MTFGYGPNTFSHSAAHVLNSNHSPSRSEGEPNNKIQTSAANYKSPSIVEGAQNNVSINSYFTGSTFNVVPNSNKDDTKILLFTLVCSLVSLVLILNNLFGIITTIF